MKLNKTETKAMWTMHKHGFTWAGDSIFSGLVTGKRALNHLERLGLIELKNQEPGFLPEFRLSAQGEEFLRYVSLVVRPKDHIRHVE